MQSTRALQNYEKHKAEADVFTNTSAAKETVAVSVTGTDEATDVPRCMTIATEVVVYGNKEGQAMALPLTKVDKEKQTPMEIDAIDIYVLWSQA